MKFFFAVVVVVYNLLSSWSEYSLYRCKKLHVIGPVVQWCKNHRGSGGWHPCKNYR